MAVLKQELAASNELARLRERLRASEADTATAATPIEAPTLEKQVDAPQLSLGDVTDLLKGLDGLEQPLCDAQVRTLHGSKDGGWSCGK